MNADTAPQPTSEQLLRRAWDEIDPADPMAAWRQMSLEALAADQPDLQLVVDELKAPPQARLELHLTGTQVRDHAASASALGTFMKRAAEAVKEIAKSLSGLDRHREVLLASALAPGSIQVAFQIPDLASEGPQGSMATNSRHHESVDSSALWTLATVFDQAERDEGTAEATIASLRPTARAAVGRVARTIADEDWDVAGSLTQQGRRAYRIHATHAAATRLLELTREDELVENQVVLVGEIDGLRRSHATMWFIPVGAGAFTVGVSDAGLQDEVARLAATPNLRVEASMTEFISTSTHGARAGRKSYLLRAIRELAPSSQQLSFREVED